MYQSHIFLLSNLFLSENVERYKNIKNQKKNRNLEKSSKTTFTYQKSENRHFFGEKKIFFLFL